MSEFDLRALLEALHLKRLVEAPAALETRMPTVGGRPFEPDKVGAVILRGGNVTADTKFGGLDVVQRLPGVPPYPELAQDAVQSNLLGVPVRVCSLDRLRGMKRSLDRGQPKHGGRPRGRGRDTRYDVAHDREGEAARAGRLDQ